MSQNAISERRSRSANVAGLSLSIGTPVPLSEHCDYERCNSATIPLVVRYNLIANLSRCEEILLNRCAGYRLFGAGVPEQLNNAQAYLHSSQVCSGAGGHVLLLLATSC